MFELKLLVLDVLIYDFPERYKSIIWIKEFAWKRKPCYFYGDMLKNQLIIPVGEYYVSTDSRDELITVVGSCVAVTLYDKDNHIGGLVHIVLPGRRMSRREDDQRAFFADTGMQLLIEEVSKAGANRENIEANVVGGASTISDHEEDTIGVKNAKTVISILKTAVIPIRTKDIGGESGRKMLLCIDNGKLDIWKSAPQSEGAVAGRDENFSSGEMNRLIRRIERFKPDENVAGELLEAVHKDAKASRKIREIISRDFVLAYHIFRICNSAYYGLPNKISSIPDAIRLLGARQFRLICVLAGTMRHQDDLSSDFGCFAENLTRHSHATALIAGLLALRESPDLNENGYSAGLLHGIGKFGAALLLSENGRNGFLTGNSDVYAKGSAIARNILAKWNIPGEIAMAVADFNTPPEGISTRHKLTAMVHVACRISRLIGISYGGKIYTEEISKTIFAQAGLPDGLEPILPSVFEELETAGLIQKV